MKKIFSIFALAIITAAGFTACNDDDNEWVDPNGDPLKVISNDTQFQAAASTGSVVVDTQDPVTVTSNDNGWVTTTVNGNTIEVAVEENRELDGRVATLTIKAGSKKTDVSIVQSGAIFKIDLDHIYRSSNAAYTTTANVTANLPITFTTSGDWITATYDEGTGIVTIRLTANTTKHMRQGYVEYTCGNTTGRIPVKQCVFSTDIVGDYEFVFLNPSNNRYQYFAAKVAGTTSNCRIEIPALNFTIPVTYNTSTFTFTLAAGQQMGTYPIDGVDHIVATVLWDTNEGYLTWDSSISISAEVQNGYLNNGDLVTIAQFEDNGSWSGYTVDALRLEAFTATPLSKNTRVGSLANMVEPYLLRTDVAASTSTSATSVKGMKMTTNVQPAAVKLQPADNVKIAY